MAVPISAGFVDGEEQVLQRLFYIESFVDSTCVEGDRESNDEQKEMDADYRIESRMIGADLG